MTMKTYNITYNKQSKETQILEAGVEVASGFESLGQVEHDDSLTAQQIFIQARPLILQADSTADAFSAKIVTANNAETVVLPITQGETPVEETSVPDPEPVQDAQTGEAAQTQEPTEPVATNDGTASTSDTGTVASEPFTPAENVDTNQSA
jgi:hypothetical protein